MAAALAEASGDPADPLVVLVNGRLRADLSRLDGLPRGVVLGSMARALDAGDDLLASHLGQLIDANDKPFAGLNAAMMADGMVLRLARGAELDRPVRLVSIAVPEAGGDGAPAPAFFPRHLIVAGANSRATVIETHLGPEGPTWFADAVTEISVGEGAHLAHYRRQAEGTGAFNIATGLIRLSKDATYDGFALATGADLSRWEVTAVLDGPGGDCRLNGAYLGRGSQQIDNTTLIDHAAPDCRSRQVFKGVLDDQARGVFQARIGVRRDAQRTDGHQLNKALLLSRTAEIDSKPELEIFADDVKCSHGATAGEIDREALFYLRSRGIAEAHAHALLIEAFVRDAVGEIGDDTARAEFDAAIAAWLDSHRTRIREVA
jgi:Fe-S cluster assembly protein SufD